MERKQSSKRNNSSSRTFCLTLLLGLAVATAMVSCDRKTVYDHYGHTPVAGWEKNDTLVFGPIKIGTTGAYVEQVGLRVNGTYPFQALCLVVEHHVFPQGTVTVDTVNCAIVNRDGSVRGQGVSYYQYNFPLKERLYNHGDSVFVYIRHNMKREMLPGVSDVGLRVASR